LITRQPEVYTLHLRAGTSHFLRADSASGGILSPRLDTPRAVSVETQTDVSCSHGERSLLIHY
jgi:hypothetical protein